MLLKSATEILLSSTRSCDSNHKRCVLRCNVVKNPHNRLARPGTEGVCRLDFSLNCVQPAALPASRTNTLGKIEKHVYWV